MGVDLGLRAEGRIVSTRGGGPAVAGQSVRLCVCETPLTRVTLALHRNIILFSNQDNLGVENLSFIWCLNIHHWYLYPDDNRTVKNSNFKITVNISDFKSF